MFANRSVATVLVSLCSGIACFGTPDLVMGQRFGTIQLPTYQQFSMSTSLWVPDQGSVYTGGIHNSRTSRRRGLRTGAGNATAVTISAYIHDFEALDAAVLEEGRRARVRNGKFYLKSKTTSAYANFARPITIGEVRARTQSKRGAQQARARADFDLAQRLMAKGKTAAAQIMLKSALSRADESLRGKITLQMETREAISANERLAQKVAK